VKRTIIYGPPGTGKTAKLLSLMERELRSGTPPDRIAFVSFTRNAVQEARARAQDRFRIGARELPWFRTLHSLAFAALGLSSRMVMANYDAFAAANGFNINSRRSGMEAVFSERPGDERLVHALQLMRATQLPISEVARRWRLEGVSAPRLEILAQRLNEWKREHKLLDWADMIDEFLGLDTPIKVDVAFVDEAQDLTAQQWRMVNVAFRDCPRVVIAGDDDQAIYEWSGADVNALLRMDAERHTLSQSHRVPRRIQTLALGIANRIRIRQPKSWAPVDKDGAVERIGAISSLPLGNGERWLLLGRTAYPLSGMRRELERAGLPYAMEGVPSISEAECAAVRSLDALRRGEALPMVEARRLFAHCAESVPLPRAKTVRGEELSEWLGEERALSRWKPERVRYVSRAVRLHGAAIREPRIEVSTIHGAKGSEAPNVVLCTEMSRAPSLALRTAEYADAEHRVWYVGATRAQERLFLLRSGAEYAYSAG